MDERITRRGSLLRLGGFLAAAAGAGTWEAAAAGRSPFTLGGNFK